MPLCAAASFSSNPHSKPRKAVLLAAAGDSTIKEKLLKGHKAGDKTFKVHLDGYNQMDYLSGKSNKSARDEFFYFSDDGDLLALRYQRMKIHFMTQEATGIDVWRHAAQDDIKIEHAKTGTFEIPQYDPVTLKKAREALQALFALEGIKEPRFGRKDEVEPISWLVSTAVGWGGNPRRDAIYVPFFPKNSDGKAAYTLKVKDVPVDGFWSITMYDAKGFMFENEQKAYSLNNVTAKTDADGAVSIQFGGDPKMASNFLPIAPGWNYIVRLYRPRKEILDGTWKFPEAAPVGN